jgi:hypothetical protein
VLNVRKVKTGWRIFAVATGTALAVTLAATRAYAGQPGEGLSWNPGVVASAAGAAVPAAPGAAAELLPMSTSWPTPQRGIVLSYPSRTPGSGPSLFVTGNDGRSWNKLPSPPLPFPASNDTPDATWTGGVIAITDGTRIVATHDGGGHWSQVHLTGLPASVSIFVGHITITGGRMFTVVTSNSASGTSTATVYSGPARSSILRAVPGLSISGGITYGNITAVGGLQVSLGSDYVAERYWLSRDGVRFVPAPLPCPVTTSALLGGVRGGRPIALCSGSPSDLGPGQDDHQIWTATSLGGRFSPSGPAVFTWWNQQAFAAASDRDMTVASVAGLDVTFDGGQTWTAELPQPNGASWQDLAFPSSTVGVVVNNTVNDALQLVGTVYQTTDAGRSWHALSLP